ncbi:MAG: hypothetical protein ACI80V_001353 [Rhodothermales bacterium]|jgi:hypothetical protein
MRALLLGLLTAGLVAGCTSVRQETPDPDGEFGTRVTEQEDGRITTVIGPEDGTEVYRYADAFTDDVRVRPEPESSEPVAVEVLIKGAFPDSCTELHEAGQTRAGNIVNVTLRTRRPQGALCAAVIKPYRFYLLLEGGFAPGPYTVKVNGGAHPFEVKAPQTK